MSSPPTPLGSQEPSPKVKVSKVLSLVEMAHGEFSTLLIHKPFSLTKLKQPKTDLGSYTTNPDNYIDQFQHISMAYDLTLKVVIIILGQTLSDLSKREMSKRSISLLAAFTCLIVFPIGETAVPSGDPNSDYNDKVICREETTSSCA